MAEERGTIQLNGEYYRIDLTSYRDRDVSDFSPRTSTPGGGIIFSEMALYQPLNITDFKHGFGFHWFTDAAGYQETLGNVDTRHSGIATLFTALSARDTAAVATNGGFAYTHNTGYMIAWNQAQMTPMLWTAQSGAWSEITALAHNATVGSTTIGDCRYVWSNGAYTFFSHAGGRLLKSNHASLTTWTETGVDANASNYIWLIAHDGYVYAGKYGTNQVYYGSAEDLSDLHGTTASDPNVILVGTPGRVAKKAISFAGDLFFARDDGLFRMDKDRSAARRVLDYADQLHSSNFQTMAVYNGALIFPIRNQLYQWNGTRVSPITPPRLNDTFPYVTYTNFRHMNVIGNHLFMMARTSDGTNDDLIAFDGVGWFKLMRVSAASTSTINAMNFISGVGTTDNMWLYAHATAGSPATGIYKIPFNTTNDLPYASFPTTGTNAWITSRIDAGFRRVQKSTPSILVEASNILTGGAAGTNRYLKIYYRLNNDTAWTAWGNSDGTTNKINATGITELDDPTGDGTGHTTIEYYWIQFKIEMVTEGATQTPVLEGLTLRLLMRPDTDYGFSFNIVAAEELEAGIGHTDIRDSYTILDNLKTARDSKAPITFVDPFGISHQVYVTSVTTNAVEEHADDMGAYPNLEAIVQVNLVEVR